MNLYSESIIKFLNEIKLLSLQILQCEMGIQVGRSRFVIDKMTYPLHFVVFEGPKVLGYFKPELFEIGINKIFITETAELKNTLRHELVHYLCWIYHKDLTHGMQFRNLCENFGYGKEVWSSKTTLLEKKQDNKIAFKVKKLLALSKSPNVHEAQAALLKANALLIKHSIAPMVDADMALKRVLSGVRSTPKWDAISKILRTFNVYPVVNKGNHSAYLEVFGCRLAVSTAEYVAHFLDHELERLWKLDKTFSSTIERNSFFDGIADGYLKKIKPIQKPHKKELALISNALEANLWMPYPHLSKTSAHRKRSKDAFKMGTKLGKKFTIRPGVEKKPGRLLIP